MPEQRGRAYHRARIGETLKEEIGVIIEGELGDPRIALCTVTEICGLSQPGTGLCVHPITPLL